MTTETATVKTPAATLECYRVFKPFTWDGHHFAPKNCRCACDTPRQSRTTSTTEWRGGQTVAVEVEVAGVCTQSSGTGCKCGGTDVAHGGGRSHCSCALTKQEWAGDVWVVAENHPRKEVMLLNRFVGGDGSLPSGDEVLKSPALKRLATPAKSTTIKVPTTSQE